MARRMVLLLGLAGCDTVFQLHYDEPLVEPASCQTGSIFDELTDPMPCRPWGFPEGNAEMIQDGKLTIRPAPNSTQSGTCTAGSAGSFADGGIFLEVSSMFATTNTYAKLDYFEVTPADALDATLLYTTGRMYFASGDGDDYVEHANGDYDPVAMRWWRMRPDRELGAIVADFSPDGRTWNVFGVAQGVVPQGMKIVFAAGTYDSAAAAPGTFAVERLSVCP